MPGKKKVFSKVKAVKDAARAVLGTPKTTREIPDAKRKAELSTKHKKPLQDLLED